jgi:hypothetical protein
MYVDLHINPSSTMFTAILLVNSQFTKFLMFFVFLLGLF